MRRLAVLPAIALVGLLGCAACSGGDEGGLSYFSVPALGLKVPKLAGWNRDTKAESEDVTAGGVVMRLVRDQAIPGAPRIDVTVTPKTDRPLTIDEFLNRNLHEMTELEKTGNLRIASVDTRPMQIGPRRAFRVRHEYMLGGSVAITQSSTLLVLDGRGVAVTATGRTELYQPVASGIEVVLTGLKTPPPSGNEPPPPQHIPPPPQPKVIPAPAPTTPEAIKPLVKPIDLGKVGGGKK